ncbi:hypothetical protein FOA52_004663 [Chlamydomonas sp. UWO 241]|nr:hypothetical protein FOA52_004663 [Chlamydomonas sp. UWO 241]
MASTAGSSSSIVARVAVPSCQGATTGTDGGDDVDDGTSARLWLRAWWPLLSEEMMHRPLGVASIYKAKDAADAANYRPLTMLGSDYRILAKVLATRWTPLLAAVVGPEQTAFLAGRRISDNICLTQMLPGLLAANAAEGVGPTGAALALLDFRKAYDTIDRGCLLAVMEAVGVGDGVLAWTRTILTHTYASAEVNGFISEPRRYAAGVRQGCPAAPALFLFLGHALACFLRTCPAVGVEVVPGCRVTCPQYADDCMPLLRSCAPAAVAALVEAMAVFGRATGLVLNLGKCGILPLGSAGEGLLAGAEVAGLRVLDAGVSLGVPVSAGLPPPEAVTGVCRERLAAAYTKLARFPMDKPNAVTVLGIDLVIWWDGTQWVCMSDVCPHRLSPLSMGRQSPGSPTLTCSYHGWAFDSAGSVAALPQGDPAAPSTTALLGTSRACARTFPCVAVGGLVYGWMDDAKEGLMASLESAGPGVPARFASPTGSWGVNHLFNDFSYWAEQSMDPSHANFLHAGIGAFIPSDARPMESTPIPSGGISTTGGYSWHHGGYELKNLDMRAVRTLRIISPWAD